MRCGIQYYNYAEHIAFLQQTNILLYKLVIQYHDELSREVYDQKFLNLLFGFWVMIND
jgi:hypothetical protein